jgi:uncharacterized protein (DUF697 family)
MTEDHGISPRSSRIVAAHATIAGLCPLIPVPFVDDLAIRNVVQRMYTQLYEAHGYTLPVSGAKILGDKASTRLRDAMTSVVLFPIKKIVRKVVYVLAVKDCADVASAVFHDGWLLARVLEAPLHGADRKPSPEDPKFLRKVRKAMLKTYEEVDPVPLRRALVGAFLNAKVGVRHGVKTLQRLLRERKGKGKKQDVDPAAVEGVQKLSASVSEAAMGEGKYMDALERIFQRHLGQPSRSAAAEAARA